MRTTVPAARLSKDVLGGWTCITTRSLFHPELCETLPLTQPAAWGCRDGRQPPGARARVREKRDTLRIDIPPASLASAERVGLAGFAVTWNVGIGVWTASALAAGSVFAAAFSIPFWAAGALPLCFLSFPHLAGMHVMRSARVISDGCTLSRWSAGFSVAREALRSTLAEERVQFDRRAWSITLSGRLQKSESAFLPRSWQSD